MYQNPNNNNHIVGLAIVGYYSLRREEVATTE
jgi:hypothetical protein